MDRAIYDRMAAIDGEHWWFTARRRIVEALIVKQAPLPPDARILEVGAGTGSNLALLQRYGRVDAIEPDEPARALAAKRSGIAVQGGLLPGGARLPDDTYDLIVLLDVLEHIPDDRGALAELARKLKPGGRLVLTVPAFRWLWSAHDEAHHHHRRYSWSTLAPVFAQAGLTVRHRSYFNTLLMPLVIAARLAGKLTGRSGGDDAMPAPWLNRLLATAFGAERHFVATRSWPVGVSLGVVAERSTR